MYLRLEYVDTILPGLNVNWGQRIDQAKFLKLCQKIRHCGSKCRARSEATLPVPPRGTLVPDVVVVGRNPGYWEDKYNRPFYYLAPSGKLLNMWLRYLGLDRSRAYITNTIFCYTAGNRVPKIEEIRECSYYKELEFSLISPPKLFMLCGGEAIRLFLGEEKVSVVKLLGSIFVSKVGNQRVFIVPLPHPSFVLRNKQYGYKVYKVLSVLRESVTCLEVCRKGGECYV